MRIPKTLTKNALTYLVVLIIPLGVSSFFFHTYLIQQFQKVSYEKEKSSYRNTAMEIEQQIEQIKGMATQLSTNPDVLAYHLASDWNSKYRMISMLKYSLSVSDTINDILLIDDSQNIYTSSGSYTLDTYSKIYKLPVRRVNDHISKHTSLSLRYLYPVYLEENNDVLYLACNYPFSSPYPSGILLFQLDRDRLIKLSGCTYAVYYDGLLVDSNRSGKVPLIMEEGEALPEQNPSQLTVKYDKVTIMADIDTSTVFQDFYTLRNQFVALEIFIALISLPLISFFCYSNYQPLRKLKNTVSRLENNIYPVNTLNKINSEIDSSIRFLEILALNNKQLDDRLLKEKYNLIELWLSRLLNHQYKNIDTIRQSLKEHDILLDSSHYAVSILKCSSPVSSELYPVTDSLRNNLEVYFCHYTDTRIAAIIGGNDMTKAQLIEVTRAIIQRINQQDISVEAYVGPLYPDVDNINLSYIQAISLIDYEPVHNGTLHLYNLRDTMSNPLRYPQTELNNLNKAILQKDFDVFHTIMQALIGQISNPVCDYTYAKTIIYALINSIACGLPSDFDVSQKELRLSLTKLERSICKADLVLLVQNIYDEISKQMKTVSASDPQEKIDAAINYINEHYDEIDFFLGNVAEHFDISINNLSQQFKRKYGVSPIKYVTSLRIEKAKRLLLETSLSVNDISLQCGFSELTSFLRNFKSLTIVTPTQYRNANFKDI